MRHKSRHPAFRNCSDIPAYIPDTPATSLAMPAPQSVTSNINTPLAAAVLGGVGLQYLENDIGRIACWGLILYGAINVFKSPTQ